MTDSQNQADIFDAVGVAKDGVEQQRLADAVTMVNTLVNDMDGHWLARAAKQVRKGPDVKSFTPSAGLVAEQPKELHFRSAQSAHNVSASSEKEHYRTFRLPAGSRVTKVGGRNHRTWVICVDNGRTGEDRACIYLMYNRDKVLMLHGDYWSPGKRRKAYDGGAAMGRNWSSGRSSRTW